MRAGESNSFLAPVVGSRSILVLDGPTHMRQRKLMLPPFHGQRMQSYAELIARRGRARARRLAASASRSRFARTRRRSRSR